MVNRWIGPSPGPWSDATRWSLGVVPQNGGGTTFEVVVHEDSGAPSVVAVDLWTTIDSLTIGTGAEVTIDDGQGLMLANGVLLNDGILAIESGPRMAELRIVAAETSFNGDGAIELMGSNARIVGTTTATHLMNGAAHSIRGGGRIGFGKLRLTNLGVIEASAGQQLELEFTPSSGGVTLQDNQGLIHAVDGGTLAIVRGVFLNVGGVIEAGAGSTVRLGIGAAQQSESVSIGGGVIRDADGDGPALLEVGGAVLLSESVVDGAVRVIASAWPYAGLSLYSDAPVPSKVTLEGDINGAVPAILNLGDPVGTIGGCTIVGMPGRWNRVQGPPSPPNACIIESTAALFGSFEIAFGLGFENRGVIDIDPWGALRISGLDASCLNADTGVIRLFTPPSSSMKSRWYADFENRGVVEIAARRVVELHPGRQYVQAAGVTRLDGRMTLLSGPRGEAMLLVTGGRLLGAGEIVGPIELSGGVLDPDSDNGAATVFTVTGDYEQGGDAVLRVDLGDGEASSDGAGDRVSVSGTAMIAGTLQVRFAPGVMPLPGEAFTVLTASSVVGEFAGIDACAPIAVEVTPTSVIVTFTGASLADLNDDGVVDGQDLGALLGDWGRCAEECCRGDFNGDRTIDGDDLGALLGAWS